MEQSILSRDPDLEASFSFSGQDFSPALAVFPVEVEDDQYIEIALGRPVNGRHLDDGCCDQELEFRLSFSSSVPFLQLPSCGLDRDDTVETTGTEFSDAVTTLLSMSSSTSASTLSFSSTDTRCRTGEPAAKAQKTIRRKVQFRSVNRLLSALLSNPATSSAIVNNKKKTTPERESWGNHRELIQCRKQMKITKTTTTTTNGGIVMNFLVKCRSVNIRTILKSFMKPYQYTYSPPPHHASSGQTKKLKRSSKEKDDNNNNNLRAIRSFKLKKPFGKWLQQKEKEASNCQKPNAIRGILEAATSSSFSCIVRKTKNSRPSATKFSIEEGFPIETNSIQAAIAHCKSSFGQSNI